MKLVTVIFVFVFAAALDLSPSVGGTGVKKCYYCHFQCKEPLEVEECANDWQDFRCYTSHAYTPSGVLEHSKGCVLSNDVYWQTRCETLNFIEGDGCYMCDEDMCNYD